MTSDGTYTMTWDAENRMVGYSGTASFKYDGNSLRVSKTVNGTTTVYIRAGAQTLAEYTAGAEPTAPSREYIYAGGQLLASKASGNYKWYVRDHLSPRMVYEEPTATLRSYGHLPFGENWYGEPNEKRRFTSYEWESGLTQDFAVFRQYQYDFGRFSSADPLMGTADNPQSWNRYTYVQNRPTLAIDPNGLNMFEGCSPSNSFQECGGEDGFWGGGGFGDSTADAWRRYGLASQEAREGLERYESIRQSGFDPICGCYRGSITVTGIFENSYMKVAFTSTAIGIPDVAIMSWANGTEWWYELPDFAPPILSCCDLKTLSDFSAGAGDTLSLGGTYLVRKYVFDSDSVVDRSSGAYWGGVATGAAVGAMITGYGAGPSGTFFGRGGLFNSNDYLRMGWNWMGSATAGRLVYRIAVGSKRLPFHWHF